MFYKWLSTFKHVAVGPFVIFLQREHGYNLISLVMEIQRFYYFKLIVFIYIFVALSFYEQTCHMPVRVNSKFWLKFING